MCDIFGISLCLLVGTSVKPLADIVRYYTCCDRRNQRDKNFHLFTLLPIGSADKISIHKMSYFVKKNPETAMVSGFSVYLKIAFNSFSSFFRILSKIFCTSSPVRLLSAARNTAEYATLFLPSGICSPS